MMRPRLIIKPWPEKTRLLLTCGDEEVMRTALPPPRGIHPRAAETLLTGLALWLGRPLSVVLCADAEATSSALGLCDGFGVGVQTAHYEVEVVDPRRRTRALGPFRDLQKLERRGAR
ncbi:MAG: hypothetical protein KBB21_38055 [Nannocystaceae bacterium]|jgi:hypothetical protein|nr:hypothetical protein [Nannocystaceae bacterium]